VIDFAGYRFSGGYQLSTGCTAGIHVQHINEFKTDFLSPLSSSLTQEDICPQKSRQFGIAKPLPKQ
jgi:hypothetical protein